MQKGSRTNDMRAIWELPQNIVGCMVLTFTKTIYAYSYLDANVYVWYSNKGLSLGKYIFVPVKSNLDYVKHEYGHTLQSKYLGWFYLLVIGLPSIVWAGCFKSYRKKHNISYYAFYTERWADRLGGVERSRQ